MFLYRSCFIIIAFAISYINGNCILPITQISCCRNVFRLSEQIRLNTLSVRCSAELKQNSSINARGLCDNLMCIYECAAADYVSYLCLI